VDECAEFSLHLLKVVAKMDWSSLGLPPATACLGMHGGPLFPGYNPVEDRDLYFGAHVCRAARIKAVTPAGHAYASEQFVAALAVADGHKKKVSDTSR
jgi:pilus assembly protein FimV